MYYTIVGCGVVRRVEIPNFKVCRRKMKQSKPPPPHHKMTNFVLCATFSSKDFEILDFDPPNNPTSHYGACYFGYNLALNTFLRNN